MEINNEIKILEEETAIEARKKFEANIANIWGHSTAAIQAKQAAMTMLSTKSGLYAKVPITCKADSCPYAESCALIPYGLAIEGEKCPWETAMIEIRYQEYANDYDLDEASFTDKTLIAELVNIDIMLERTKALMSTEQIPIEQVVAGITESGEEFSRPEISKAFEIYEKNLNRKDKLLDSLLGTRKSRKGSNENTSSITDIIEEAINVNDFIIEEKPENL